MLRGNLEGWRATQVFERRAGFGGSRSVVARHAALALAIGWLLPKNTPDATAAHSTMRAQRAAA